MVIISSKPGQLGNMLFLFSVFIANSLHHKYKLLNPAFVEYVKYFPKTNSDIFCRYPPKKTLLTTRWLRKFLYHITYYFARLVNKIPFTLPLIETIHLEWEQSMDLNSLNFIDKAKNKILFVQGWQFRDNENFNKYAGETKKIFTPQTPYLKNIETIMTNAKKKGDIIIGIHIRRGDYKKFEGGRYFYSWEEYKSIMKKITALFPNHKTVFLISSNEKRNANNFDGLNFVFGTGQAIEDLYSFARCDYLIGPPSTYTMWASFYGAVPLYMMKISNPSISIEDFQLISN